jgi:hypothetical protein
MSDGAERAILPERWRDLDKRTIELIARMNEEERRHLVDLMNLDDKQLGRLRRLLSLPDEKWEAGFKVVTRSAIVSTMLARVPKFVLGIAALLVAIDQIWKYLAPYVLRGAK